MLRQNTLLHNLIRTQVYSTRSYSFCTEGLRHTSKRTQQNWKHLASCKCDSQEQIPMLFSPLCMLPCSQKSWLWITKALKPKMASSKFELTETEHMKHLVKIITKLFDLPPCPVVTNGGTSLSIGSCCFKQLRGIDEDWSPARLADWRTPKIQFWGRWSFAFYGYFLQKVIRNPDTEIYIRSILETRYFKTDCKIVHLPKLN